MSTIIHHRLIGSILLMALVAGLTTVQGWKVQLVPKTTSVKYVVPVVTSLTTVPSTCYVTVNVTGDCRRRRSIEEKPIITSLDDIDDILPTLPRLETSASVESVGPSIDGSRIEEHIESKRGWTFTARPLDGFSKVNRWISDNRPAFGLTYVDFETVTLTRTTYSTVTDGHKTFVVSGCLPAGFLYTTC
ncbi:hypothetical protein GHT06_011078 [Daphnia sinensis]|uniref:Uncharacterized protein n=1 Tax=Daphnia sinensis TaxID=1820382 RepID=A0AAD5KZD0_9CRUS|nr:hypothetical protein GHT06_011078 [Daphnia sinensis]